MLRILTKFFKTEEDDETVPTKQSRQAARLQRLNNYLKERGITPERFEEDCKKSEESKENIAAQTYTLANGGTITRDELNSIPVKSRIPITQEINATLLNMTARQYIVHPEDYRIRNFL